MMSGTSPEETAVASFPYISLKETFSTVTVTPSSAPSSLNCLLSTSYCASAVRFVQITRFCPS